MGFYLRKSFRLGPVRLNLSKSGLGISAGVRGARIGMTSSGKSYVHAGRGGLYLRQNLASSTKRATGSTRLNSTMGPTIITEATGVTFGASIDRSPKPSLHSTLIRVRKPLGRFFLLPCLGLVMLLIAIAGDESSGLSATILILSIPLLTLWPIPLLIERSKIRAADALGSTLAENLSGIEGLTPENISRMTEALADNSVSKVEVDRICRLAYLSVVISIVEDRQVSAVESTMLEQLERLLNIPAEFVREARREAYREVYLKIVSDNDLTEAEEIELEHVRSALRIDESEIQDELNFVAVLRNIRDIRNGDLREIETNHRLQKSEVCYFESSARLLKMRNLRSFQEAGQRYKVRGYVIDKEGTMIVTNKRLLIIHEGTTSVPLAKILDLEVDVDDCVLMIAKDGSSTPVIVTTREALVAGAVVSAVAGL